ncbi:efflux RND transporter periplasmic adaptor subunit [Rhizobium sp. SSA_523]|uniref:efflux RND transporter periplasmic adaptor subunit n=1 Tax=Rhizobium sp. SSA_523 TaxID=2952477 RepID=UPI00209042AF|nr:efflux RND transporter periplasmic adaptor subunit [Rhizobium sp. SSA_523]MCO5734531.1 efflux RND transporter periplasmic adaptor subunit [Rhizobium sp. SSA_523]WKC23313.1 efflux RND transporter periplasmic adaptor subunit [Rhizobium sp. SSA_523]
MKQHRLVVSLLLSLALVGCSDQGNSSGAAGPGAGGAASQERPPTKVAVSTMTSAEQPLTRILPGRAVAFREAEVRPRVNGIIEEITFKEGSEVKAGDILYRIDDETYRAALEEARATLAKAQASVPSAQANFSRYERLVNSGATQIEYENARVALLQAQADVAQAKAALQTAEISLGYTEIRAPFDGVTTISNVSIGNIVTANQTTALTTLRQIDPIYVDLNDSSSNLLELRAAIAEGRLKGNATEADIRLALEDGTEYPKTGKLDMAEMAVSLTTGTYQIRAVFDNPDNLILPGMYVRATVIVGYENGYLIPQRAATRNANGTLTAMFVGEGNKVEPRTFDKSQISGNDWLVTTNIKDGDRLIIDGLQKIAPGAPVDPVPSTINEQGIVVETPAEPAKSEAKP